jgi:hypothetical protein
VEPRRADCRHWSPAAGSGEMQHVFAYDPRADARARSGTPIVVVDAADAQDTIGWKIGRTIIRTSGSWSTDRSGAHIAVYHAAQRR